MGEEPSGPRSTLGGAANAELAAYLTHPHLARLSVVQGRPGRDGCTEALPRNVCLTAGEEKYNETHGDAAQSIHGCATNF